MSMSMSNALPETKTAGIALILGVVLSLFVSLLYPGGVLIDPVDQSDFPAAIGAMSDNANLTHVTTLLFIFAILLEVYGLLAMFHLVGPRGRLEGAALRFGLVGIIFSGGLFIIELSTRHMVVHMMTHGVGAGTGSGAQAHLQTLAEAVYSGGAAVHIAFLSVGSVAAIFLGLGLAPRFAEMNVFKLAAYGMILVGVVGLLNLAVVQHIHDFDLNFLALVSNVLLSIGAICYFAFGVGMYLGRSEFAPDDASG